MTLSGIIAALGGYRHVADRLGLPASTVYYWLRRGSIPNTYWPGLLTIAAEAKRSDITAESLVSAHQAAHDGPAPVAAA